MSQSALPLISERDFPAFQRMIPELRHTDYAEWLDDHKKAIAYRQPRNGYVEISFSPEEFDGWLKAKKEEAHMELLWAFAEDKAAGLSRTG
jgi:UDP-N-acetylglucosamine transferase subunit ALG13